MDAEIFALLNICVGIALKSDPEIVGELNILDKLDEVEIIE